MITCRALENPEFINAQTATIKVLVTPFSFNDKAILLFKGDAIKEFDVTSLRKHMTFNVKVQIRTAIQGKANIALFVVLDLKLLGRGKIKQTFDNVDNLSTLALDALKHT